eukprot:CAMPEP_0176256234 /NCGR_PEP_ID=MMETSP0121_2-20121125/37441_1 /TAXON_ID=160619 /ORGANISM="Kryptoperidinium foliaceum, Strain CCMP 1326" /LENGTH=134 /DNA_ID=CAMNT_0017596065 /DNA_START=299 /DNA_END=699 /DNA_ORIENTATION=+
MSKFFKMGPPAGRARAQGYLHSKACMPLPPPRRRRRRRPALLRLAAAATPAEAGGDLPQRPLGTARTSLLAGGAAGIAPVAASMAAATAPSIGAAAAAHCHAPARRCLPATSSATCGPPRAPRTRRGDRAAAAP